MCPYPLSTLITFPATDHNPFTQFDHFFDPTAGLQAMTVKDGQVFYQSRITESSRYKGWGSEESNYQASLTRGFSPLDVFYSRVSLMKSMSEREKFVAPKLEHIEKMIG